ncbi:hypothetical protein [Yoonia sp.]|uniref:hypothetical protein n=1 Tax=Yoonia sp. TaxID=2212373 RepID=UPI00358FF18A
MTLATPIEDFLEAITAQLDKTQDSLRLKAVNRPLTFAIKDFNIDLSVFVEMDATGLVRLRPSGPNEVGASVIKIGFTTITRPMIEENTISMELTQSPSLEDAGFSQEESKQLERLGVRNVAQLDRLRGSTDEDAIAQYSRMDPGLLRKRLKLSRPQINMVKIGTKDRALPERNGDGPARVPVEQGQERLSLRGKRLSEAGVAPRARLDGQMLPIRAFSQSHIDVDLPGDRGGLLELDLPDGMTETLEIMMEGATPLPADTGSWSDPDSAPPGEDTP